MMGPHSHKWLIPLGVLMEEFTLWLSNMAIENLPISLFSTIWLFNIAMENHHF